MQRNLVIIVGVFVVACILLGLVLGVWWTLLAPAASSPTLTSVSAFVTLTRVVDDTPSPDDSPTLPPTIIAATLTPSSTPVPTSTPSATAVPTPTYTPIRATSTPQPTSTPLTPYAVMNSPHGYVNIRSGPGVAYDPPLGTYQNGVVADVLGQQYSSEGDLWWLLSFPPGPLGRGWVYAGYTEAQNVGQIPWVTAPPTPTPITPSATPRPHAIINSPDGFLNVRSGPGGVYQPPLGRLNSGTVVDVIGKQRATNGALWWLIPFSGNWTGQGWIYASYTIARNTDNVPWVAAPPTPTLVPPTPTPTPTLPPVPPIVNWTITGRVVDAAGGEPVGQASVQARLGNDGTTLSTLTDNNGNFSLVGRAHDDGNLTLTVNAFGYEEYTKIAGAIKPRVYNFSNIGLVQQQAPVVTWVVTGRVVEIGTYQPVANADVSAVLGDDGVQITELSDANGQFSMYGQARDSGTLGLTIAADGYQPFTTTYPPNDSRIYNLADLSLVPLADSCAYESVINLSEATALARLQSLNFTSVATTSVVVNEGSSLIGQVVNQIPDPPPEGQSVRVNCQLPISLGIGSLMQSQ